MRKLLFLILVIVVLPFLVTAQKQTIQRGNASFYHDRLHGRRMANGERYNKDSMTCAHMRYPLGTLLRVRNLTNGKEVVVRVTDRGPYTRKFVIDLSRAAARKLDIIQYGFRQVEITPFVPGKVPYKYEPSTEKPELDLGYTTDLAIGAPYWQDDSIYLAKHRLSRTEVPHLDPDTLQAVVEDDTTLRQRAVETRQQRVPQKGSGSGTKPHRGSSDSANARSPRLR